MFIALASPRVASSLEDGLDRVRHSLSVAAARGAEIVCFPEAYLPGLRGLDFEVPPFDHTQQDRVLKTVAAWTRSYRLAAILGMEWLSDAGRHIAAVVFDADGRMLGCQTKNQLDPTEDPLYVPGHTRQLFEVNGVKFGVAICHEGFRYPETVRWAAVRGARIVFHPHCTGSDEKGVPRTHWAEPAGPYYERAMMCRALENTIYFAGVNYAFRYPESATCLIDPTGQCIARLPYGEEGLLVHEIDPDTAAGLLASRYAPERYQDSSTQVIAIRRFSRQNSRRDPVSPILKVSQAMNPVDKAIATQIANIEKKTGKSLAELTKLVKASGLVKHGEIRDMLKDTLGLGHGDANTVAHMALDPSRIPGAAPAAAAGDDPAAAFYTGPKAALKPIHVKIMAEIAKFGDFEIAPKKTYLSLRRKKQFAMVGPATNTQVEVGLNMKGVKATSRLIEQPEKNMCQYKVRLASIAEVDKELIAWIKQAFDAAG